jgi:hypothetical protein
MKMVLYASVALLSAGLPATAPAQAADRPIVREALAELPVVKFLESLKSSKLDGAVEQLLSNSLWSGKTLEIQALKSQANTIIQAYGPVQGYDLVQSEKLGTSAMRQYYLVRHEKMVTRWEFDLVRTGNGWSCAYFGFDDQVKTWF